MRQLVILALAVTQVLGAPSIPTRTLHPRLTGGKPAERGQFPYQISYQYYGQHVCGGSILSPNYVLTAGHCVTEVPSSGRFTVVAGIISLKENVADRQEVEVEKKIVHPNYAGGVNPYDIAILKLKTPLKLSNNVKAIPLPERDSVATGTSVLSGWGSTSTSSNPSYPDNLQTVQLPLLTIKECGDALTALLGSSKPLHETNVCTGPLSGGQSACSGDSGGPLAHDGKIIGVVSWGIVPCGSKGAPSVYVQVSNFIDFIKEHVTDLA